MNESEWRKFLSDWEREFLSSYSISKELWSEMGLSEPNEVSCFRSIQHRQVFPPEFSERAGHKEIKAFYNVTDGWPLFLGEDSIELAPLSEIGLFRDLGAANYVLAKAAAFDSKQASLAVEKFVTDAEIDSSVLLSSSPHARDLVLWLDSGELLYFSFESAERFNSLRDFLEFDLRQTIDLFSSW